MSDARTPPRALALALALALVPFLLLVWRFDYLCDDAFISFRYARNLVLGRGLRFNVGVEPPVEGYSELLWVLLMAGAMKLGLAAESVSRLLSLAAGVALVLLVVRGLARRAPGRPWALAGAALFLGTLAPLAVWTTGGMGTMAFVLAVFALHEALLADPARPRTASAAVWAVLAVLLRADGAYWVAWVGGAALVAARARRDRGLARAALIAGGAAAAVFAAHVAWRLSYYGDWLPNTARVKVGLSAFSLARGAKYVGVFLLTFPAVALALAAPALLGRRALEARTATPLALALGSLLYAVAVGGDFMCFGRFVLPALPFAALTLGAALARWEERGGRVPLAAAAVALAATSLLPAWDRALVPEGARRALHFRYNAEGFQSELAQWRSMRDNALRFAMTGRALALYTKPDATLVTGGIGAVGYFSDRFLWDQNGLVTREVALGPASGAPRSPGHDKAVPPEHFLDRDPTFLRAFLWDARRPLPDDVRPRRDLVVALPVEQGFPPNALLVGVRPPRR